MGDKIARILSELILRVLATLDGFLSFAIYAMVSPLKIQITYLQLLGI